MQSCHEATAIENCAKDGGNERGGGGRGGSSIVKVPGDVPPARVCFFKPSSLAKGILFANFRPFSLGKGIIFGNFGQRNVKLR